MNIFDVVVIGGGIVGIACARHLTLAGARVCLVERDDVLSKASGHNSGILHCGFDGVEGLLETTLVRQGSAMMRGLLHAHNITTGIDGGALRTCDAIMVGWSDSDVDCMKRYAQQRGVKLLDTSQVKERVPQLRGTPMGGLLIDNEWIVDSGMVGLLLLMQALEAGLVLRTHTQVTNAERIASCWHLNNGQICARWIVNAAGTNADLVQQLFLKSPTKTATTEPLFRSIPRKGQFVVMHVGEGSSNLQSIIYPVPNDRTKGVVMYPALRDGLLVVGPTAEDQTDRDICKLNPNVQDTLIAHAHTQLAMDLTLSFEYAGLRPATEQRDYHIRKHSAESYIVIASIRSTGFTSCLAIAFMVAHEFLGYTGDVGSGKTPRHFNWNPHLDSNCCVSFGEQTKFVVTHPLTISRLKSRQSAKL
jgi:glycerol-3-phosphate dehydrogenase